MPPPADDTPPAEYGNDPWTDRGALRAVVFEMAGGRCEHPVNDGAARCGNAAAEMAHIFPRGMGHTGYRDTVNNVMAACRLHARTTDDLSTPAWSSVPRADDGHPLRDGLRLYVLHRRRAEGWAL